MPSVIKLKSGQCETVFDLAGLLYLVEQHMGDEARRLLEDFTAPESISTALRRKTNGSGTTTMR